jgi:hypothetical protein
MWTRICTVKGLWLQAVVNTASIVLNDIFAAETTAFHTTPDCFLPIVRAKANLYPGGSPVQL